eukprot:scaffold25494_cov146-Isochrysis_galbana.AAC.7
MHWAGAGLLKSYKFFFSQARLLRLSWCCVLLLSPSLLSAPAASASAAAAASGLCVAAIACIAACASRHCTYTYCARALTHWLAPKAYKHRQRP